MQKVDKIAAFLCCLFCGSAKDETDMDDLKIGVRSFIGLLEYCYNFRVSDLKSVKMP